MICAANTKEVDTLAPDLNVDFQCQKTPSEGTIESFLTERNFVVANEERLRRQFNLGFFPMEIEGYDRRRWSVHFIGLIPQTPDAAITYHADVNSPPPTKHDSVLEDAVIELISQTLKCKITSLNRSSNPHDAAAFYDRLFAMQVSRDHEAAICDKSLTSFDATQCEQVPGVPRRNWH